MVSAASSTHRPDYLCKYGGAVFGPKVTLGLIVPNVAEVTKVEREGNLERAAFPFQLYDHDVYESAELETRLSDAGGALGMPLTESRPSTCSSRRIQ